MLLSVRSAFQSPPRALAGSVVDRPAILPAFSGSSARHRISVFSPRTASPIPAPYSPAWSVLPLILLALESPPGPAAPLRCGAESGRATPDPLEPTAPAFAHPV